MNNRIASAIKQCVTFCLAFLLMAMPISSRAQDRLKTMPGYEQYQKMSSEIPNTVKSGSLQVSWKDGGKAFEYKKDGKGYHYDIATKQTSEATSLSSDNETQGNGMGRRPERGRQFDLAMSPDGKLKAFYRNRNLWLSDANGANEIAISTDGDEKKRIKYGVASWVYGEELRQNTAMWWSPNNTKIAYYRFDESPVTDYFFVCCE